MAGGAFQTSREIFENPIWQDIPKFRIFFFIVGNAVFSPEGVRKGGITIQRGQYLRSYRNLRQDLEYLENRSIKNYSLSVIKRKIDSLVKEERLKIEDTELGTLFTVVNYDMYQGFDHYKNTQLGTALERSENRDGTEMERQENNNNNVNKDKNVKKKNTSPKQVYDEQNEFYIIADFFVKEIRKNFPDFKTPNMQVWSDDIRKLVQIDEKDKKRVCEIIRAVQTDSFWFKNCASPKKLREKFSDLELKFLAKGPEVKIGTHKKTNELDWENA